MHHYYHHHTHHAHHHHAHHHHHHQSSSCTLSSPLLLPSSIILINIYVLLTMISGNDDVGDDHLKSNITKDGGDVMVTVTVTVLVVMKTNFGVWEGEICRHRFDVRHRGKFQSFVRYFSFLYAHSKSSFGPPLVMTDFKKK
jgi:hypothetical protein